MELVFGNGEFIRHMPNNRWVYETFGLTSPQAIDLAEMNDGGSSFQDIARRIATIAGLQGDFPELA